MILIRCFIFLFNLIKKLFRICLCKPRTSFRKLLVNDQHGGLYFKMSVSRVICSLKWMLVLFWDTQALGWLGETNFFEHLLKGVHQKFDLILQSNITSIERSQILIGSLMRRTQMTDLWDIKTHGRCQPASCFELAIKGSKSFWFAILLITGYH